MNKKHHGLNRRKFLSQVAAAGAGAGLASAACESAEVRGEDHRPDIRQPRPANERLTAPSAASTRAEREALAEDDGPFIERPKSDFMVDVLKQIGIEFVATCPGSSFRGLHESIVNYAGNKTPELLTCLHEEICVGMAHGYAKVAGEPMAVLVHGTVGLQHAAMAVYNAWCDHAPALIIAGNHLDAAQRKSSVHWIHSVQDAGALLRDCTKWDDSPISLAHFAESAVRAHVISTTPPMAPVVIVADGALQEEALEGPAPSIPRAVRRTPPQADGAGIEEAAKLLASAGQPVIIAERLARTAQGMPLLIELAELLQAPVIDLHARLNFPTSHYLNQTESARTHLRDADVILGLEVIDFWGTTHRHPDRPRGQVRSLIREDAKSIVIGIGDHGKSNYQNFQRYAEAHLPLVGDAEASLPLLIDAIRRSLPKRRSSALEQRGESLRRLHRQARQAAVQEAFHGWSATPISVARMCADVWQAIRHQDWALVSDASFQSNWQFRLWDFERPYQFIGGSGGFGIGYNAPAAIGAALAHRRHGRLAVNIQGDGDLMFVPSALWTAAHHEIPLLTVVHNNRAYHQEIMHIQRMANRRQRGVTFDRIKIGTAIDDPAIDYKKLAQSMGMWAYGPVTDANELLPAIQRAIQVVNAGEPALIDVVSQGR